MGNQTTKGTFEVPVCANPDGTLDICPFFHRSPIFSGAGGYAWSISYYPESLYDSDSIDLCLQLESNGATVTISSSVALIDPAPTAGSLPPLVLVEESPPMEFDYDDESRRTLTHWVPKSMLSKALAQYMTLDSKLVFQWTVTVISVTPAHKPMPVPMPMPTPVPKVPAKTDMAATAAATDVEPVVKPENISVADVTYSVGGKLFHAHKVILAARSPVFMAELSATTTTGTSQAPATIIEVADMRPDVFEALLHYIYSDTLPSSTEGEADDEDLCQMMRHLLVAADRYGVEGLKLLCEGKLSEMLDVENVAEMLRFADDHYCSTLKDACVEFMVASSERMAEVVTSHGYQRLRLKRPSILVDVFEKSLMKRKV